MTRLNDELRQSNAKEVKSGSHYFESEVNDLKTIIEYRDEKYSKLKAEFKKLLKNLNSIQNQDYSNVYKITAALADALNETAFFTSRFDPGSVKITESKSDLIHNLVEEAIRLTKIVKSDRSRMRMIRNSQHDFLKSKEPLKIMTNDSNLDFEISNLNSELFSSKHHNNLYEFK